MEMLTKIMMWFMVGLTLFGVFFVIAFIQEWLFQRSPKRKAKFKEDWTAWARGHRKSVDGGREPHQGDYIWVLVFLLMLPGMAHAEGDWAQQEIQNAMQGGYVIEVNGVNYGTQAALQQNQDFLDAQYINEEGIPQVFIGQSGGYVTKETFEQEHQELENNMLREMGEHYQLINNTRGDKDSKGYISDDRMSAEQASMIETENMVKRQRAERVAEYNKLKPALVSMERGRGE